MQTISLPGDKKLIIVHDHSMVGGCLDGRGFVKPVLAAALDAATRVPENPVKSWIYRNCAGWSCHYDLGWEGVTIEGIVRDATERLSLLGCDDKL